MRHRPDLIVPVRDRRQHKRYLTLRNFRNVSIIFVLLFVGITIRSELRGPGTSNFGRLYERELPPPPAVKPMEVVQETPQAVPDQAHADPMLVEPLVREQWLHGDPYAPPTSSATMIPVDANDRAQTAVATGETRVAIVGGAEGVAIVQQQKRRPVLGGGFGR
jgi:hypothetical protein